MSENSDVTYPLLRALTRLPDALFYRQQCGRFRTLDGRRVVATTSIDGIADIMGVFRGRPVAIETKTLAGKQRETQRRFQHAFEKAGGLYLIARAVDDAIKELINAT